MKVLQERSLSQLHLEDDRLLENLLNDSKRGRSEDNAEHFGEACFTTYLQSKLMIALKMSY